MEGTGARAGICGAGSAGMGKGIWGGCSYVVCQAVVVSGWAGWGL